MYSISLNAVVSQFDPQEGTSYGNEKMCILDLNLGPQFQKVAVGVEKMIQSRRLVWVGNHDVRILIMRLVILQPSQV